MSYQRISSEKQLDELLSSSGPAWVFKHSMICPTSNKALDEFESYLSAHPDEPAGVVVVQQHRDLCRSLAERLGIRHQSPQVFLVDEGDVQWHASHGHITATNLADAAHAEP